MHHFFVPQENIGCDHITITGKDVNHMKNVLRMNVGENFTAADGQSGQLYLCRIDAMEKEKITASIEEVTTKETELPCEIYLFQGLPKSDKMEWIVQKAVELGVTEIIPVITSRTIVKLDQKKAASRTERWNAIAEGACKQSGRMRMPKVQLPMTFAQALKTAGFMDVKLIPYELAENMEQTRKLFGAIRPGEKIAVFIGPEGGFAEEEVQRAIEAGFSAITLGRRILRTETAGLAVLAMLGLVLEK